MIKLSNIDREFFSLVTEATFSNPFSPHREQIDQMITGLDSSHARLEIMEHENRLIVEKLRQLDQGRIMRIEDFDPADRELMKYVFLFVIYHQYAVAFDDLIIQQEQAGTRSIKVRFADQAITDLTGRGFQADQISRFFAMFYQIRRAFHLIDRMLIGPSPCMRQLRMNLWNNIFTHDIRRYEQYLWDKMEDFSTLLEGPTGSGKGAAAAAIGQSGYIPFDPEKNCFAIPFTQTLVEVNLAQFTPTLIESELFGHARGAFTGAVADYDGVFSRCRRHGTIFLDEISEIRPNVQVKLLRVLQERTFWPVGSHDRQTFEGRVIGATNQPVADLRRTGRFRDDFYYRLCADCIRVPSLRQRIEESPDELPSLVGHFIRQIIGQTDPRLAMQVLDVIGRGLGPDYPWPGNVRELAQCIRRVILKQDYERDSLRSAHEIKESGAFISEELTAQELLSRHCAALYDRCGNYGAVARITGLDRRTVKKYIEANP
jgi:DNA-binding NtrC family response regulator